MAGPSMKGIVPGQQTNWDARAAGNFIGGGSGTGLLVWGAIAGGEAYLWFALAGLALVGIGLTCVWAEIGKPWRAINVIRHPQTSWMTREALVAPLLFMAGLAAAWAGGGPLAVLTAAIALVFLYCQGRILFASKGIPAWREPRIVPLIMATGLAEGAGWATLLAAAFEVSAAWLPGLLAVLVALRAVAWRRYLSALRGTGAPVKALQALDAMDKPFMLAGSGIPAALAVLAGMAGSPWLAAVAGVLAALAGAWLKLGIVTRASYNQGFALPKLPVRGVGIPAAGVKPGWSAPQQTSTPSRPAVPVHREAGQRS